MYTWRSILNVVLLIIVLIAAFVVPWYHATQKLKEEDRKKAEKHKTDV